jgi:small subunit ribosomal protein S16
MLAIRLQRQGRKGFPVYRIIVQEAQLTPTSGRVVAYVGSFNPHTKETNLKTDEVEKYLSNGAQPTPRVVKLLLENKVKLPNWVEKPVNDKAGKTRFADKLRKNQPKEEPKAEVAEVPAESETEAAPVDVETPTGEATEAPSAEADETTPAEA